MHLQHEVQDQHVWCLTQYGAYSSKSAYEAFVLGTIRFVPWKRICKTWAPPRCKFFIWLAIYNRCWTAERLAKRNLPHLAACTLCDQDEEQLTTSLCHAFSQGKSGHWCFRGCLLSLAPQPSVGCFSSWWSGARYQVPK